MDSYFGQEQRFRVKHAVFTSLSQDINWWTGVDYCDVLSAVWTLILSTPIDPFISGSTIPLTETGNAEYWYN